MSMQKIETAIKSAQLEGHSGYCGAAAIAINRIIFEGQGTIVGITNKEYFEYEEPLFNGHIAVLDTFGEYWDWKGRMTEEEFTDRWGTKVQIRGTGEHVLMERILIQLDEEQVINYLPSHTTEGEINEMMSDLAFHLETGAGPLPWDHPLRRRR
tara:strand:- start:2110 stop:2571 length:462 start_codon:yes stop_codon:yes gene_type:complete